MQITEYHCKEAEYMGTVNLYADSTYSRDALINGDNHDELMKKIKEISGDSAVITFKAIENVFCTEDKHMSYMKTQYNGYELWMNTFKDYHIRTIQMWLI